MRIAIVDDSREDQAALRGLLDLALRRRQWAYTLETYPSGEDFLAAQGRFDLVFLDMLMGGIDGLETARRYRAAGGRGQVVFVTVEADFAVEGYEVEAAAFLVKPAQPERLGRVLDRLARRLKPDVLLDLAPDATFSAGAILYVTATSHCLKVHTAQRDCYPGFTLGELRARLPGDGRFVECSRGMLVNLDHVSRVEAKTVLMDDASRLPVSRRRRQAWIDAIADWKFSDARGE